MDVSIVSYGFMQNAIITGLVIGIILPIIGVIILSRRMIFLADSLGHINMSGIALASLLGANFAVLSNYSFLISILWTILGAVLIEFFRDKYQEYKEVSITIVYALSVALTMIFLNFSTGINSGLFNILFGNINAISRQETISITIIGIIILIIYYVLYPKLMLLALEEDYLHLYGINPRVYRYITMIVVTLVISIAIKVVGVLLVSSLLLIPLLSAARIAKNLRQTYLYTMLFTEISLILGIFVAYYMNLSSSAIIVLTTLVIYAITLMITAGKK